tara:strand:+ start:1527 stop:1910 length:384 start_codon:yes stop_codon:yes gene_type:complete
MDFSNFLADSLINATTRAIDYSTPAKVWVALYTTDPTKEDVGTEVDQASYNRLEVTITEPVDGVSTNANEMKWSTATTAWGVIAYVGIRDAETDGNLLYFTNLEEAKDIQVGDQFQIVVDNLTLTLS